MLDPERRAALRAHAESFKTYHFAAAGGETVRRLAADVFDLLAALEAAEQAIRDAIAAAEAEGIDRYRGTDERREMLAILYGALEGAEPE